MYHIQQNNAHRRIPLWSVSLELALANPTCSPICLHDCLPSAQCDLCDNTQLPRKNAATEHTHSAHHISAVMNFNVARCVGLWQIKWSLREASFVLPTCAFYVCVWIKKRVLCFVSCAICAYEEDHGGAKRFNLDGRSQGRDWATKIWLISFSFSQTFHKHK